MSIHYHPIFFIYSFCLLILKLKRQMFETHFLKIMQVVFEVISEFEQEILILKMQYKFYDCRNIGVGQVLRNSTRQQPCPGIGQL